MLLIGHESPARTSAVAETTIELPRIGEVEVERGSLLREIRTVVRHDNFLSVKQF